VEKGFLVAKAKMEGKLYNVVSKVGVGGKKVKLKGIIS